MNGIFGAVAIAAAVCWVGLIIALVIILLALYLIDWLKKVVRRKIRQL